MRSVWFLAVALFLLGGLCGCGSEPAIEIPENPTPPPKSDLVSEPSGSPTDNSAAPDAETP